MFQLPSHAVTTYLVTAFGAIVICTPSILLAFAAAVLFSMRACWLALLVLALPPVFALVAAL
jgi:hypothetical protein